MTPLPSIRTLLGRLEREEAKLLALAALLKRYVLDDMEPAAGGGGEATPALRNTASSNPYRPTSESAKVATAAAAESPVPAPVGCCGGDRITRGEPRCDGGAEGDGEGARDRVRAVDSGRSARVGENELSGCFGGGRLEDRGIDGARRVLLLLRKERGLAFPSLTVAWSRPLRGIDEGDALRAAVTDSVRVVVVVLTAPAVVFDRGVAPKAEAEDELLPQLLPLAALPKLPRRRFKVQDAPAALGSVPLALLARVVAGVWLELRARGTARPAPQLPLPPPPPATPAPSPPPLPRLDTLLLNARLRSVAPNPTPTPFPCALITAARPRATVSPAAALQTPDSPPPLPLPPLTDPAPDLLTLVPSLTPCRRARISDLGGERECVGGRRSCCGDILLSPPRLRGPGEADESRPAPPPR